MTSDLLIVYTDTPFSAVFSEFRSNDVLAAYVGKDGIDINAELAKPDHICPDRSLLESAKEAGHWYSNTKIAVTKSTSYF